MIRPQLRTATTAPATLVSLARVGIAGLSMASLLSADAPVSTPQAAPAPAAPQAAPAAGTAPTVKRVRATV